MINPQTQNTKEQIRDYLKLFHKHEKVDLLKYAYNIFEGIDWFQSVVNNPGYYVYPHDIALIEKLSEDQISSLNLPKEILEIGPGCSESIVKKTIVLLKKMSPIQYTAIDIYDLYAESASSTVLSHLNINTSYLIQDAFKHLNISHNNLQKTIMLLGGTLGNFSDSDISVFFNQLECSTQKNDYFITTVDTCTDENVLKNAYNNNANHQITLNCLRHFNLNISPDHPLNFEHFETLYRWNKLTRTVEFGVKSKCTQEVTIGTEKIQIGAGDEFMMIYSRKDDIENLSNIAAHHHFSLINTLSVDGSYMKMLCFKRN